MVPVAPRDSDESRAGLTHPNPLSTNPAASSNATAREPTRVARCTRCLETAIANANRTRTLAQFAVERGRPPKPINATVLPHRTKSSRRSITRHDPAPLFRRSNHGVALPDARDLVSILNFGFEFQRGGAAIVSN